MEKKTKIAIILVIIFCIVALSTVLGIELGYRRIMPNDENAFGYIYCDSGKVFNFSEENQKIIETRQYIIIEYETGDKLIINKETIIAVSTKNI